MSRITLNSFLHRLPGSGQWVAHIPATSGIQRLGGSIGWRSAELRTSRKLRVVVPGRELDV